MRSVFSRGVRCSGTILLFLSLVLFPPGLGALTDLYWELPAAFSGAPGSFPVSASNGNLSVIAWQEPSALSPDSRESSRITVSLGLKSPGLPWRILPNVAGPYGYTGAEPAILSLALDKQGRILIAAAVSATQTEILLSEDEGQSFSSCRLDMGSESSVAPRVMVRSDGGYLLFVTRSLGESLSIYYSRSDDARTWSPFQAFVEDPSLRLSFLPVHAALDSRDYVIFQSLMPGRETAPAFQLFLKMSDDGGLSWTPSRRITGFRDPAGNTGDDPERFDNQRAHIIPWDGRLFLTWERRYGTGYPQIYSAVFDREGSLAGAVERINRDSAHCNNPVAFLYRGSPMVIWFDNRRRGNRVYLAQHNGVNWLNHDLSGSSGEASFGRPVVDGEELFVFWQNSSQNTGRIYALFPDLSVKPPSLAAGNFIPSGRGRGERIQVSWNDPGDSSGILGYSYVLGRFAEDSPPREILIENRNGETQFLDIHIPEDGSWYLSVIARDFAGNWSDPARVGYIRDITPPSAAAIIPPETDGKGFLLSNTFSLEWNPPPASDIAGYTWELEYLGSVTLLEDLEGEEFQAAGAEHFPPPVLPPRIMGKDYYASFDNRDDGLWRFTVSAIDEVGNIGPPSSLFFKTDKYIPRTYITYVEAVQDEQGVFSARIIGRGFSQGGSITRLILDQDGLPPYDREYFLSRGEFRVASDREIDSFVTENLGEGLYRVGVEHPLRGLFFTPPLAAVDETGTVKFGDYSRLWKPAWTFREGRKWAFDPDLLILYAVLLMCFASLFALIRGAAGAILDSRTLRMEAAALLTGDFMPWEKKKSVSKIRRRGISLRLKLASFTVVLVLVVVVIVAAPLYFMMTRTQQVTLFRGLWNRSAVLLEGLASSARAYFPSRNLLELGFLPAQIAAVPEARYVTITGYNSGATVFDDHVWTTNDPDILSKIDTAELQPGVSRLTDTLSPRLADISRRLNEEARRQVVDLSRSISELNREGASLALMADTASRRRLEDIQVTSRSLEARLTARLAEIAQEIGSEPAFSLDISGQPEDCRYILFKPVLYCQGDEDYYFRGLIRLEVSTESILAQIAEGQWQVLRVILLVALAALSLGTLGALALSGLIIRPILRLVSHVERIRDTEDKANLEGVEIEIRSHDDLAVLGGTINDMTHGLVKAAIAASDLSIGKEIQKKFIPLDLNQEGDKLSSGFKDTKSIQFFGYYEGAKGVSGDYFDYQDLDGRYYAIIKCDVAGKGIPAALIMIQVATMFLNYFKQWKPTARGMHIEEVVYQINEFIETLGFKGRFAAFALCLLDSQTGIARFCNAGDNLIHIFDASENRVKTVSLPETPATGVLPNFLVESKGGYQVQSMTLDPGDILFLYTDGIEEAKRGFRSADFKEIPCTEGNAPADTPHGNHVVGQENEELGSDRVEEIINSVMNRQVYTLRKWHNPEGEDRELIFDFGSCRGTVEEVIMALVSVEKIFRCYRDPKADDTSRILVDKKVDAFLKAHFLQYRNYCSRSREVPGNDAYMYYTYMKEDEQYDDLTILGIKRK
ncbi:MAG: SpoIIE family protein phosphatase [Treponema sp.]|jgi:serine phosphatase RsbU (regulator of sigma subunit)|nr:SpoIIE family protein phosphatase [Treponema sp.]